MTEFEQQVRAIRLAFAHRPECPANDDCHVIHGGRELEYACSCDIGERYDAAVVAAIQAGAAWPGNWGEGDPRDDQASFESALGALAYCGLVRGERTQP